MDRILWIGFLNDLFCGRSYIAAPAELSIPVLLVKNPLLYRSQSGGKRKVSYGDARSNSERAAPSIALRDELSVETHGGRKHLQLAV
jgi:hypothetical protein